MKLVRQPEGSNLCGQACVATICNISLEDAIILVRTKGKTKTKHLKCALHEMNIKHGERRFPGMPKEGSALLYWQSDSGAHWTVWHRKKHYDPSAGVFRKVPKHLREARVTSHLPITV